MSDPWYRLSVDDAIAALKTSREHGLTPSEAATRQARFGWNEITFKKTPAWIRFLRQFNDAMVIILLVTAAITGLLTALGSHMLPDTLVILGVVVLNAILGFIQEGKAEGALEALRGMMVPECLVIRGGDLLRITSRELVPGDIVVLEGGDKIPADVRFIDTRNVHVDESSLTGESVPVEKNLAVVVGEHLVPGDQKNIGFAGTYLTQGTARGLVVETGSHTVFGQIAAMVKAADAGRTPLQRKMSEFVGTLIKAILAVGAFNFAYGLYLGYELGYSLYGAVSLVVAAIPEMLPALVTSILAVAGTVMASRKALIRKLPAAETLGATSVICSDKTGTLTENHMTVTQVHVAGQNLAVSGVGYDVTGHFSGAGVTLAAGSLPALGRLLEIGVACNNAHLSEEGGGVGDPTELALLVSAAKGGITKEGLRRYEEIPFDSSTKYMAVLVEWAGRRFIAVKGAPEILLPHCLTSLDATGQPGPIDRDDYLDAARVFARQALRTLGFAFREVDASHRDLLHADLRDLTFAGLQGMIDPPKPSAIEAVAKCRGAGIRTVMVTGDHPDTALAVAAQLGIEAGQVLDGGGTGGDGRRLPASGSRDRRRLRPRGPRTQAAHRRGLPGQRSCRRYDRGRRQRRTSPQAGGHRHRHGHRRHRGGAGGGGHGAGRRQFRHHCQCRGRGPPRLDQPSEGHPLHPADQCRPGPADHGRHHAGGPGAGVRGSLRPRAGADPLDQFTRFGVAHPAPYDGAQGAGPAVAAPRDPKAPIIDALFLQRLVVMGLAVAVPGFLIYYHFGAPAVVAGEILDPLLLTQAQTAAFWAVLLAHFGYVVSARSIYASAFTFSPFGNPWLLGGIAISILIRLIPTLIPAAADLFRTAEFPSDWWPLILLCFFPSFLAIEADKLIRSRLIR